MRHIILLSHEILAYGLLQTARHVLGSVEGCTAYCAYMNPYINDEEAIERLIGSIPEGDLILVTDMWGSSVTNLCLKYLKRPGIYLVSGMSLPLIIDLMSSSEPAWDLLARIRRDSSGYIRCVYNLSGENAEISQCHRKGEG